MSIIFLLATTLQAGDASPPVKIDILKREPCAPPRADTPDEIIVCGQTNNQDQYRIRSAPYRKDPSLPRAEIRVSKDVKLAAETEAADVGGFQSNRGMIRLKLRF